MILFSCIRMCYKSLFIIASCEFMIVLNAARILGVFGTPSISHHVVFRAYAQELVKRGHSLVIISSYPGTPTENVTEINIGSLTKQLFAEAKNAKKATFKRGVIIESGMTNKDTQLITNNAIKELRKIPELVQFMSDRTQHFDLVFVEAYFNFPLIFGELFKAPVIQMTSCVGIPENYETLGAVSRHPTLYPNIIRNRFRDLTFWETLYEMFMELRLMVENLEVAKVENQLFKELFGPDFPTVQQLKKNVVMLFVNSHPIFDNNRPVPPNVVYLGAMHLAPVKVLPEVLQKYLDSSNRGVVYVSLGTNVDSTDMDKEFLLSFLHAFEVLPYDILWKLDDDILEKVPSNVKIQKWFPQRDLLTHPNVKAFVTQGGVQSTDEAIDAGVPLVGIPILGDQWFNVDKYIEFGLGIQLDAMTITADDLVKGIKTVIDDASYKHNIVRLRSVIRDQKESPLERAVWWTGHVLRHGGARHLRAPSANMPWTEYYMLHYIIVLASGILVTFVAVSFVIYRICSKVKRKIKVKVN